MCEKYMSQLDSNSVWIIGIQAKKVKMEGKSVLLIYCMYMGLIKPWRFLFCVTTMLTNCAP